MTLKILEKDREWRKLRDAFTQFKAAEFLALAVGSKPNHGRLRKESERLRGELKEATTLLRKDV